MAACFSTLAFSGKRQFTDIDIPAGRPPRHSFSHRPPRGQTNRSLVKVKNSNDVPSKNLLSSTYKSFSDPCESEVSFELSRKNRSKRYKNRTNKENESDSLRMSDHSNSIRRHKRDKSRRKIHDGYSSDTGLLSNRKKIFLSTFKSNDNEFETAFLETLREKSKSIHNIAEAKKFPMSQRLKPATIPADLVIEKLDKINRKKSGVTFSEDAENSSAPKKSKYSVLKNELPSLTFEQMKKAANTIHPKLLYSTKRYQDLHLTIFYGDECINPLPPEEPLPEKLVGSFKRFTYETGSLRRQRKLFRNSLRGKKLFRSHSEGNLDGGGGDGGGVGEDSIMFKKCTGREMRKGEGNEIVVASSSSPGGRYLRVLNRSWRNLLTSKLKKFNLRRLFLFFLFR